MRVAVIDLGTNTFNLLIAEKSASSFKKIFGKKLPAKLGAENINGNMLSEQAVQRGLSCLKELKSDIDNYAPEEIFAFGTSAIRSAKNGEHFAQLVKQETEITINIISGDKEAELIYFGNKNAFDFPKSPSLILDIGGGSNEFILCNDKEVLWKASFDLGVFRLIQKFTPSYPISSKLIEEMEAYFESELSSFFEACKQSPPVTLIGSSGSFDSFRAMLELTTPKRVSENSTSFPISVDEMEGITRHICSLSLEELKKVPGIDTIRVEIITVATVFIWYIVKRLSIQSIEQSSYSLKEGVVFKLINNEPV